MKRLLICLVVLLPYLLLGGSRNLALSADATIVVASVPPGISLKTLQWDHAFINLPIAWQYATNLGAGATVCDVDSGLEPTVTDIAPAVIDAISTVDFTQPDQWQDVVGHGTFTSGQAVGRGFILDGVAPRANLIVAQALGLDGGDFLAVSSAIIYCITHGAQVVNMSFGFTDQSEHAAMQSLIDLGCENGVDFAIAAGNSQEDGKDSPGDPASNQSPCAIVANAVGPDGQIAKFSNYDEAPNTVSAPGVGIVGHWGTEVAMGDGTSFSAPLVAGTMALLRAQGATATEAVSEILKTAAPPTDPRFQKKKYRSVLKLFYGHGLLSAGAALRDWALSAASPQRSRGE